MGLLQDKLSKFRLPQLYMERGVYPYFREIDSHQDTEVIMDGKKVLMFGSNSYMGLTYDERIIEAAVAATRKYGTGVQSRHIFLIAHVTNILIVFSTNRTPCHS